MTTAQFLGGLLSDRKKCLLLHVQTILANLLFRKLSAQFPERMDPGIEKLLSLPFFGHELESVLICFGMVTVELFLGFGAQSSAEFVDRLVRLAPVLAPTTSTGLADGQALQALSEVLDQLATLSTLLRTLCSRGKLG